MNETINCFLKLKSMGINLEKAIDVGAYRGEFTDILETIWPGISVQQFEADERQKQYLKQSAKIVVLSNIEEETNLYTIEENGWGSTTGTSLFIENTEIYQNKITKKSKHEKIGRCS